MKVQRRTYSAKPKTQKIKAEDELDMEMDVVDEAPEAVGDVSVDPEATELVFEAEDVAELVAEVTGEEVSVTVDTDAVVFTVGEDEFTVEPEGDEEILESSRRVLRGKKPVKASRRMPAAKKPVGRPIRRK